MNSVIVEMPQREPTVRLMYRAPGQDDLTQISVTYKGPRGFVLDVQVVKGEPGQEYCEDHWALEATSAGHEGA